MPRPLLWDLLEKFRIFFLLPLGWRRRGNWNRTAASGWMYTSNRRRRSDCCFFSYRHTTIRAITTYCNSFVKKAATDGYEEMEFTAPRAVTTHNGRIFLISQFLFFSTDVRDDIWINYEEKQDRTGRPRFNRPGKRWRKKFSEVKRLKFPKALTRLTVQSEKLFNMSHHSLTRIGYLRVTVRFSIFLKFESQRGRG